VGDCFFHVAPAFRLTVTLGETLGFFQKIFLLYKNPYKTMRNHCERQVFRCDFNLKTKPGKSWMLKQPYDKV
jgi:hypothetical protein